MNVLSEIFPGLVLTLAAGGLIYLLIYLPSPRSRPDFLFTYFIFSLMAYLITSLLRDVQLTLGFSFGLLAVFTLLRYRTDLIPVREMTFLYISITVPFINALFLATRISFTELIIINAGIVIFVFVVDRLITLYYGYTQIINYEKIDLIRNDNYAELLADLSERTGTRVKRAVIEEVDFLRDTALLTVYFDPPARIKQVAPARKVTEA